MADVPISPPQCLGPQVEDSKSGDWNQLRIQPHVWWLMLATGHPSSRVLRSHTMQLWVPKVSIMGGVEIELGELSPFYDLDSEVTWNPLAIFCWGSQDSHKPCPDLRQTLTTDNTSFNERSVMWDGINTQEQLPKRNTISHNLTL